MTQKMTIRPGLLVALKSTIRGGVRYEKVDLERDSATHKWETTKRVDDPAELEAATKARGDAVNMVTRACNRTSFGLLCPERYEAELDAAIIRAQDIVDAFNQNAKHSQIGLYVLKGRIAGSDEVAARAIGQEVRELIEAMGNGIQAMDAAAVRDAANKARQMLAVLTEDSSERVSAAIEAARKAAREIVRRVEKKGEAAEEVLAELDRSAIDAARIAFLDMSEQPQAQQEHMPQIDLQRVASVDWTDEEVRDGL